MLESMLPFFVIMGVIFAGLIVFAYVVKMREVRQAQTWKETTGRITRSAVRAVTRKDIEGKSTHENAPDVIYEYEVNGKRYRGTRISFAERITGDDLEAALARYPQGKEVRVAYNPLKPAEAVLEREMPAAVGMSVSLLAVFFVAAGLLIPLSLGVFAGWLSPLLPNPDRAPVVALLGSMSLLTFIIALATQREVWAASAWCETQGEIIASDSEAFRTWSADSDLMRMRTLYRPSIAYTFQVNGRRYVSDRVSFGGDAGWSSSLFFRYRLQRYPVGRPVKVYYNPANPSMAVLERRAFGFPLLLVLGAGLLVLAGVMGGLL